jgi:hypothetical protein
MARRIQLDGPTARINVRGLHAALCSPARRIAPRPRFDSGRAYQIVGLLAEPVRGARRPASGQDVNLTNLINLVYILARTAASGGARVEKVPNTARTSLRVTSSHPICRRYLRRNLDGLQRPTAAGLDQRLADTALVAA